MGTRLVNLFKEDSFLFFTFVLLCSFHANSLHSYPPLLLVVPLLLLPLFVLARSSKPVESQGYRRGSQGFAVSVLLPPFLLWALSIASFESIRVFPFPLQFLMLFSLALSVQATQQTYFPLSSTLALPLSVLISFLTAAHTSGWYGGDLVLQCLRCLMIYLILDFVV